MRRIHRSAVLLRGREATGGFPFTDVNALLHFNGSDGATSTSDSSSYARSVTLQNSATLSSTQAKFGATSLRTDSATSKRAQLSIPATSFSYATGWSISGWLWCDAASPRHVLCGADFYASASTYLRVWADSSNWYVDAAGTNYITAAWTPITGAWYFVRVDSVNNSSNPCIKLFVNEVLMGTKATAGYVGNCQYVYIGAMPEIGSMTGYVDEFRFLTRSESQYPIEVPTSEYADA